MKVNAISWAIGLICCLLLGVHAQGGANALASKESAPNPIANIYPMEITGTQNSSIFVIPIPFKLARSVIPSKWGINKKAYCELLPGFPTDSYPLVVRASLDHDVGIRAYNLTLDDFQLFHTTFPFVDFLGDGFSSFTYKHYLPLTDTNKIGLNSTQDYGIVSIPATFDPSLEAYAYVPCGKYSRSTERYLNVYSDSKPRGIPQAAVRFTSISTVAPWPFNFYVNVTNQPTSGDGKVCDKQIFIYNTTISTGGNAPRGVKGSVTLNTPLLPRDSTFQSVYGVRVDSAFIEIVQVPCVDLKGYHGTGPGDRGNGSG